MRLLKNMVDLPALTVEMLKDAKQLDGFISELQARLAGRANGARYEVTLGTSAVTSSSEVLVVRAEHGTTTTSRIDAEFVSSGEYRSMRGLGAKLHGLIQEGATVQRGDKNKAVANFDEAFEWLMEEARRGQTIQRYKGLGEMNPEQLWETTMDITARRLLKVNIEDGVAADEVFTMLMGDQVEPRREFIEKNALAVSHLDV
jgi:DNA gyrase subunit B